MMVMVMPKRRAHPIARSVNRCRQSATATAVAASVCAKMAIPMIEKSTPSTSVPTLKWLVVPRHAWTSMMTISSTSVTAVIQLTTRRVRLHSGRNVNTHASVSV